MNDEVRFMVIPAAGLGKRMRSVNLDLPKEMLPVGDKPAIQYTVEEAYSAGIREIIIIIHRNKEIIRRYFEDERYMKNMFPSARRKSEEILRACSFYFLYQDEPRGEADATALARELVGDYAFALFYPDNIYFPAPGALKKLLSAYRRFKTEVVALVEVRAKDSGCLGNSGGVDLMPLENHWYRIIGFCPKGKGTFAPRFEGELRRCGMAVSGAHYFGYIERARESAGAQELTDEPVRSLMMEEMEIIGCRLPGRVFDVGNPRGYSLCLEYIQSIEKPERKQGGRI